MEDYYMWLLIDFSRAIIECLFELMTKISNIFYPRIVQETKKQYGEMLQRGQ